MTTTTPAKTVPTQEQIILKTLQAQPGIPMCMPALALLSESMNIHTRVHAINKARGKVIFNRLVRHGRRWDSYYYYRPFEDQNKEPEFIPS